MSKEVHAATRSSYIGGSWSANSGSSIYESTDPGRSSEVVARYELATPSDVRTAVGAAVEAAPGWAATTAAERMDLVYRFIDAWSERHEDLAQIATREMGKVLAESRMEVTRSIFEMRFWAGEALRGGDKTFNSVRPNTEAWTIREPLGPVAAITPWNFPILTPIRKVIPALVSGCPVVLKPAMRAPGATVIMAEVMDSLQLPPGVFNLILGSGAEIGNELVDNAGIAGITFTGSTEVGLGIATRAASRNARVQLEMGGKNAAVVTAVADVDSVAREIVGSAFTASGQRCTAISRVIVLGEIQDALEQSISEKASALSVGYGLSNGAQMGPVVNAKSLQTTHAYVEHGMALGARLLTGGSPCPDEPDREGYYFPPTVITDVAPGSPLAVDEIFGPLLAIIPVQNFDEAVQVANETQYGLTASIFTDDMSLAHRFTRESKTGMVHVNHGTTSEGHLPFGGVGQSGQGAFGIGDTSKDFFTTLKVVYQTY
jgi:aldehyde dehydrogenase (NAD+)